MKDYLEQLAKQAIGPDDDYFDPQDSSGGNYNDAYNYGVDDGYVMLARHLLKTFASDIK